MLGWSHPRCHGTHGVRGYDDDRLRRTRMRPVRLRKVEGTVQDHGNRLDVVELRLEESQQYRFLRVEHSAALDELWKEVEDGTTGRNTIRVTAARVLANELFGAWRRLERKRCKRRLRSFLEANERWPQQKPVKRPRARLCFMPGMGRGT